jgi:hypothetical protein
MNGQKRFQSHGHGATPQSNYSTASNGGGGYIPLPDAGVDADNARG